MKKSVQQINKMLESRLIIGQDEIRRDLICFICNCLLLDTSICNTCGSTFCSSCIQTWLDNEVGCPKCQSSSFKKQKPACYDEFLDIIQIACPFSKKGHYEKVQNNNIDNLEKVNENKWCDRESMSYQEVIKHVNECQFAVHKCMNEGCEFEGSIKQYTEHLLACENRPFICIHCNENMKYRNMMDHDVICQEKTLNCIHCSRQLKQGILPFHLKEECRLVPVPCKHCQQNFARVTLESHYLACPLLKVKCDCLQEFNLADIEIHKLTCQDLLITCQNCNSKHKRSELHNNSACIYTLSNKCNELESSLYLINEQLTEIKLLLNLRPKQFQDPQRKPIFQNQ